MIKSITNGSNYLVGDLTHQVRVRETQVQRPRERWPDCKFDFDRLHSEVLWRRSMASKIEGYVRNQSLGLYSRLEKCKGQ